MLASSRIINTETIPIIVALVSWLPNLAPLLCVVVVYGEVHRKTQNRSKSIPNMENTLERITKCRSRTKMDKRSGCWQVDLTRVAQELLAFVTPKGCVFRWKVMPFGL